MPEDPFDDDDGGFGDPLPPDDRIWRHPSEVGGFVQAARRRREVSNGKLIGFAATASLLGSIITVGALAAGGAFDRTVVERSSSSTVLVTASTLASVEGTKWPEVVQRLEPALARLEVTGGAEQVTGSAVAFRDGEDGTYFVTSRDLVQNAKTITLVLSGERRKRAELIGSDQYTNLTVLLVRDEHIAPPSLTATDLLVGSDAVVVAAAPPDGTSPAVAKALVGSVDNKQVANSGIEVPNLVRTDANISAEAKGGALVDPSGSLTGILVIMAPDETGVERFGFALPTQEVSATADSLIQTGFPTQVWLGISGSDLAASTGVELGLPGGAVLNNVAVDSPAATCGLRSGDVITKLNTTVVGSMTMLVMGLRELRPTDTVAIEFVRAGAAQRCYAELARPPEALPDAIDGSTATAPAPAGAPTASSTTVAAPPAGSGSAPAGAEGAVTVTSAAPAGPPPASNGS